MTKDNERKLLADLEAKTRAIEELFSKTIGLGDISKLGSAGREMVAEEVADLIDDFGEAMHEGDTPAEWHARDERIAATDVGKLLFERYEIEEEILNIRDARIAKQIEDGEI